MGKLRAVAVTAVAGAFMCSVPAIASGQHVRAGSSVLARSMLGIINSDREGYGLHALRLDPRLSTVALAHSLDMARHGYFSHTSPTGATPFNRIAAAHIVYSEAGENLGVDSGPSAIPMLRAIEVAMLHSPEHRANLLRVGFSRVGVGIVVSGSRLLVTEDFTG